GVDGRQLQSEGRIMGVTEPGNRGVVKALGPDRRDPTRTKLDAFEFRRIEYQLRGKTMIVRVDRGGTTLDFTLVPAWTQVLPGVQLPIGRLAALRHSAPPPP